MQIPETSQQKQFRASAPPSVCRRTGLQKALSSTCLEIKIKKSKSSKSGPMCETLLLSRRLAAGTTCYFYPLPFFFFFYKLPGFRHSALRRQKEKPFKRYNKAVPPNRYLKRCRMYSGVFFPSLRPSQDVGESSMMQSFARESKSKTATPFKLTLCFCTFFKAPSVGNIDSVPASLTFSPMTALVFRFVFLTGRTPVKKKK